MTELNLENHYLTILPESIGKLTNLASLNLSGNQLTKLPESIVNLTNLTTLNLKDNQLARLPESIGNLAHLTMLNVESNQLTSVPKSIVNLTKLTELYIDGNLFTEPPIIKHLPNLKSVDLWGISWPRRYLTKYSEWEPKWLLDEDNAEIRRILIELIGYERICDELNAITIDTWREYSLLRIDNIEVIYDEEELPIYREPMVLLKMTCPSTGHLHILRVPPEMVSAEIAITWVNHGIHPDSFTVQT